jgi:hypothetical protein
MFSAIPAATAEEGSAPMFVVAPLIGFNRNTLETRDMRGRPTELEDTGLEYGLFGLVRTDHFTFNNFLFFADVNDTDVTGNVFHANYYYNPRSRYTLNLGFGFIYNKTEGERTDITVTTPIPKLGLQIGVPEYGLSLNPYVAWAAEKVETPRGDQTNDALLYGMTVGWRWRLLGATVQYYYQDVLDSGESFHTFRLLNNINLSKRLGIMTRFEYMEHPMSKDMVFLIGPTFAF